MSFSFLYVAKYISFSLTLNLLINLQTSIDNEDSFRKGKNVCYLVCLMWYLPWVLLTGKGYTNKTAQCEITQGGRVVFWGFLVVLWEFFLIDGITCLGVLLGICGFGLGFFLLLLLF